MPVPKTESSTAPTGGRTKTKLKEHNLSVEQSAKELGSMSTDAEDRETRMRVLRGPTVEAGQRSARVNERARLNVNRCRGPLNQNARTLYANASARLGVYLA